MHRLPQKRHCVFLQLLLLHCSLLLASLLYISRWIVEVFRWHQSIGVAYQPVLSTRRPDVCLKRAGTACCCRKPKANEINNELKPTKTTWTYYCAFSWYCHTAQTVANIATDSTVRFARIVPNNNWNLREIPLRFRLDTHGIQRKRQGLFEVFFRCIFSSDLIFYHTEIWPIVRNLAYWVCAFLECLLKNLETLRRRPMHAPPKLKNVD